MPETRFNQRFRRAREPIRDQKFIVCRIFLLIPEESDAIYYCETWLWTAN